MEQQNTNPIPPVSEPAPAVVEAPPAAPESIPPTETAAEPAAPIPLADPPILTPPSVEAKPQAQVPPLPEPTSALRHLLIKAREKIQSRKIKKLEKVMALVQQKGSVTNDDVQRILLVSDATATRYLGALVKAGRLKQIGHPRHARYEPVS